MIISKLLLYSALLAAGFNTEQAPIMVCIAELESGLNLKAINVNKNKTTDYGILQINDYWWLKSCKTTTDNLLTLEGSVVCAKHIHEKRGYNAWVAYNKNTKTCNNYGLRFSY
jgi:lysozyme C